tara:strand:+ start:59 stop:535 length:477 start_codon:yes stop_codon:yes gene_type:complete
MIIIELNNDIVYNIILTYIKNYIQCIHNNDFRKLFFCSKIYNLFYNKINKIFQCKLIYIKNIDYILCSSCKNIQLNFINNLLKELNMISTRENNNLFSKKYYLDSNDIFIHIEGLKDNIKIFKNILKKYNYKFVSYCCSGKGCKIKKSNKYNIFNNTY